MFMFIVPTYSCNLKCSYCFEAKDRKESALPLRLMDVRSKKVEEDFTSYMEFCKKSKQGYPNNVKFHGGEATLLPAKDLLYLCRLWRDIANRVFGEKREKVYLNMVTNGVKLVEDKEYRDELYSDPSIIISMAVSFDLFSQPVRSPDISTSKFEEFFKWHYEKTGIRVGLLSQISYHSLDHEEEWLDYYKNFHKRLNPYIENIRLRFVTEMKFDKTNTNLNSDDKLYRLLRKVKQIDNDLSLSSELIPTSYYYYYLNADESHGHATCSIVSNACWGNSSKILSMITYNGNTFTLGCAGATSNPVYNFTDFGDSLKEALKAYDTNLTLKRREQCDGCKYQNRCMPCNFEVSEKNSIYNGVDCKRQYDAIERINR